MTGGKEFFGATVNTGHGNPWALQAALNQLAGPGDVVHTSHGKLAAALASPAHRLMRANSVVSRNYVEEIRESGFAKVIGYLAWLENFCLNPALRSNENAKNRVLVVTQEFQLAPFSHHPKLLDKMFPNRKNRFLLVPDGRQKSNVGTIIQGLNGAITTVVWTRESLVKNLERAQPTDLVRPWLLPDVRNLDKPKRGGTPTVVIKTSGSGGNQKEIKKTVALAQEKWHGGKIVLIEPGKITTLHGKKHSTREYHDLAEAFSPFADPSLVGIISPASEVIGIVAQLVLSGWPGRHYTYTINGPHEEENYRIGRELGITQLLDDDTNKVNKHRDLSFAVGSRPLSSILK